MVEITEDGRIDLSDFGRALESKPKIVAFPYVSNSLGTVNPVAQLSKTCTRGGRGDGGRTGRSPALTSGVDVQAIDCELLRAIRPQDARSHGKRGAGRQASAARGDAALPRRRRDDRAGLG